MSKLNEVLNGSESSTKGKTITVQDDDGNSFGILRHGSKIVLPPNMDGNEAIQWIQRWMEEENRVVAIEEVIDAFPLDAAYAFFRALKRQFGWTALVPTQTMFGRRPPRMVNVIVDDKGTMVQVPWGQISVPGIEGTMTTGAIKRDGRIQFQVTFTTPQKNKEICANITRETRRIIREESIYRGKAITVKFLKRNPYDEDQDFDPFNNVPKFMNLNGTNADELIFPDEIMRQVEVSLFAPIEHTDSCRMAGVPLKRGVLLEGPFGTGKTLCARVTAVKAIANGWTFIYNDDVTELAQALEFARQYAPAVIFSEDIDRADPDGDRSDVMNNILNTIDGVEFKNSEIITILTTNHVEKLHPSIRRPGRLDAIIPVRPPDASAVRKLIRIYARGLLSPEATLDGVGSILQSVNAIPAAVREVVERAKLAAIYRSGSSIIMLTDDDLEIAANGILPQLKLAEEVDATKDIKDALSVIGNALHN